MCVFMCVCVCVCANGIRRRRLCKGEGKVRKGQEDVIGGCFGNRAWFREEGRKGGGRRGLMLQKVQNFEGQWAE